ncbi:MAG: late competence development ComFB family protein [Provencibacterium sp.]|jgi:competence protein ComFB|nr:late competence development ComFB family protein [Provencibacterium sp.]
MSTIYKNIMEDIVENKMKQIQETLGCCTCENCRCDIIAYALNQLPPKYVVTAKGEVYSKLYTLSVQHDADVMAALTQGANLVAKRPRHD